MAAIPGAVDEDSRKGLPTVIVKFGGTGDVSPTRPMNRHEEAEMPLAEINGSVNASLYRGQGGK